MTPSFIISKWSNCNVIVIVNCTVIRIEDIGIGNKIFGLFVDATPELTFNISTGNFIDDNFITLITHDSIGIDFIECDPTNSLFNLTIRIILMIISIVHLMHKLIQFLIQLLLSLLHWLFRLLMVVLIMV